MDGRPVLGGGEQVTSEGGKSGVIFEQTREDEALLRWQKGLFQEAEEFLAEAWRHSTQSFDLERMQRQLKAEYSGHLNLRSLDETARFVEGLLSSAAPARLLGWFLADAGADPALARRTLERVSAAPSQPLVAFAPYTTHCIRAALIFHFALAFNLVSTRPTNRVDLEYLYYTPFSNAFSSGDAFHHRTVKYLLQPDQSFIGRDELKSDLRELASWWANMTEQERADESSRPGPPENEQSITHRLWKKLMEPGYRERKRLDRTLSPEMEKKLLDHVTNMVKTGTASGEPVKGSLDGCDFVVRKHSVRLDGPCICGSRTPRCLIDAATRASRAIESSNEADLPSSENRAIHSAAGDLHGERSRRLP
jgi:hypothetical protein